MQEQPPLFLEFMQALTPHFHWIAERERCGLWMVAKRVDLWLNRVFDTAEDFRLQGALPALLGALRKLHPDAWEACLHINTSPIPRFMGGVEDAILDRSWNPLRAARLLEDATETNPRPSWRNPQGTALLRCAWGLTQLLPSLHFLLWPLPLSAAPCLGKMRVSCARWRGLWLPWGGGRAGRGRQPGPSMLIPTWTPTTTARIQEASPPAISQSAAPGAPPGVDRPELPGSSDGSVNRGPSGQPLALSEEDPQRARKLEW